MIAGLFLSGLIFCIAGCKKKEPGTAAPVNIVNDPGEQNVKEIFFATHLVTDLDMLLAFPGDNDHKQTFYTGFPASTNTVTYVRKEYDAYFFASFNNVLCLDGKTRNGTLYVSFGEPFRVFAPYFHQYNYKAHVKFINFSVDGWKVELIDTTQTFYIASEMPSNAFNPSNDNMRWKIKGKLKFTHPEKGQITWDGELNKLLLNATDTAVFNLTHPRPMKWRKSKVSYHGYAKGTTTDSKAYFIETLSGEPLLRDFTCPYLPPSTGSLQATTYPFISGGASFSNDNITLRQIDFGAASSCDDKATVIYHRRKYQISLD